MEPVLFYVMLYLIGAIGLFIIFMAKYHQDKPWYTWDGKYSLRTVYWIGLISIAVMMLFGWWYAVGAALYNSIRSIIKGEHKWNKLR